MTHASYPAELTRRVKSWSRGRAAELGLGVCVHTFWKYYEDPLQAHQSAALLHGVSTVFVSMEIGDENPRVPFLEALRKFCAGEPEPIQALMASPAKRRRSKAA